jgi:hypothetical protein
MSHFVVFSPQTVLLILIFLPKYASHCQDMLHRIAFLPEIRYAFAVAIEEQCFVDVGTFSQLTTI